MYSVVSHMIPKESFTKIDGYNGWNLYTASKHATFALNHTVRLELAALGSPIRVTVSCGRLRSYFEFLSLAYYPVYANIIALR